MSLIIGTPDWQRGVVNPSILLAKISSPTVSRLVNIPPNCDALLVITQEVFSTGNVTATGSTTGQVIDAVDVLGTYLVPVNSALDSAYTVTIPAPVAEWYVIGQSWGSLVTAILPAQLNGNGSGVTPANGPLLVGGWNGTDAYILETNKQGLQYVISTAPGTAAGDHPPNELIQAFIFHNQGTNIVAAPGAGKRFRVFYIVAMNNAATAVNEVGTITDGSSDLIMVTANAMAPTVVDYKPTGFTCATNAALEYANIQGANFLITGTIVYTVETV